MFVSPGGVPHVFDTIIASAVVSLAATDEIIDDIFRYNEAADVSHRYHVDVQVAHMRNVQEVAQKAHVTQYRRLDTTPRQLAA